MKKTAIIIMFVTIVSKFLGFLREITLSYFYGASAISDAYLIALTIPSVIFAFIGTGISTSYIPLYSNIVQEKGVPRADLFTNNIINFVIVICTIVVFLGLIFTVPLVKIFASGFTGDTLELAVFFTRIMLLGIYFTGVIYIFKGYLQIKNNYIITALIGFPFNLITIIAIALSSNYNVVYLAIGSLLAIASQLILLIPFIRKKGFHYRFILDRRDEYIKKLLFLAMPIIFSTSVDQINVLVDRTLASRLVQGGISALNYANKLNLFMHGIIAISIVTVMYPLISKMAAKKNFAGLKKAISQAISGINLLVVPASVGAMIFAEPIVRMLFGRGAFDEQAIMLTSVALFFYALGMVGNGLREVLSRAFYSLQDTKTPTYNAGIAVVLNIALNIILSRFMGLGGLALATSISVLFCTVLLFISLRKKIGPFGLLEITRSFVKIVVASLVMGLLAKGVYEGLLLNLSANLSLLLTIAIGAGIYFVLIYIMKIKEVEEIIKLAKRELKKLSV